MITIKEEFLTDAKTLRAIKTGGYETVVLWLAMKRYAAEQLTDGFVPDEDIDVLPGAPKRVRKALKALVECGKRERDGERGAGLVDEVDGGWQLHDYLDHAVSRDELELKREKQRIKKREQRRKLREEVERLRSIVEDNDSENSTVPGSVPGGHMGGPPRGDDEVLPGTVPSLVPRGRARDTQPSPAQPPPSEELGSRKPKRQRKQSAADPPDPNHSPTVKLYVECFERARGEPPKFDGKEAKAIQKLLKAIGPDKARRCIVNAYQDQFWRSKATIASITADPDKFLSLDQQPRLPVRNATPTQPNYGIQADAEDFR